MFLQTPKYFALISGLLLFPLCFPHQSKGTVQSNGAGTGFEGQQLKLAASTFESKCAVCHGTDGRGTVPATNLVDEVWKHGGTQADIERVISDGIPNTAMKAQRDQLTPQDITQLAGYVKWLARKMHATTQSETRKGATELTDSVARTLPAVSRKEVTGSTNFIDDHIFDKMKVAHIPHAALSSDSEFLRRIYLDLWGRLPEAEEVRTFVADKNPEKRDKLIDRLLGLDFMEKPGDDDRKGPWIVEEPFLAKWVYFFGDLFQNGKQGNAKLFKDYLYLFLKYDIPYDYVVS